MDFKQRIADMQDKMVKLWAANDKTAHVYQDRIAALKHYEDIFIYLEQERDFALEAATDQQILGNHIAAEYWRGRYNAFKEAAAEIINMI